MKNNRILGILFSAAMTMTLVSCGGDAKLEKAYISFVTAGENIAVFEKVYDGKAAEFDLKGVKTNSDGELSLTWYAFETVKEGEEEKQVEKKLDAAPVDGGSYQIAVSVPKTKKFDERTVKHDFTITKAPLPETAVTRKSEFPSVIHYTETGSGSRITRRAVEADVTLAKANVEVKMGNKTLVADTDYSVTVSIADATKANVAINLINNSNYSGLTFQVDAAKQTA